MCRHVAVDQPQLRKSRVVDVRRGSHHAQAHALRHCLAHRFTAAHLDGDPQTEPATPHGLLEDPPRGRAFLADHEGLLVQIGHAHAGAAGQRVVSRGEHHQRLPSMLDALQCRVVHGVQHQPDIPLVLEDAGSDRA